MKFLWDLVPQALIVLRNPFSQNKSMIVLPLVRGDIDVSEHDRLSSITRRHKLK